VTQDDGWTSLFLVTKISSGCKGLFRPRGDYVKGCYALTTWKTYGPRPYADRAWDAGGVLVKFLLHGVHRFKSL
jgi:hypothetical protein